VRIAQAVGPDLLARPLEPRKRIVVGDSIPPVLADGARRRVLAEVGHDAQDLADQRIEPLGVHPADVLLLARARVARPQVHDPPVGIAASCHRIEGHLAERVDGLRLLQAQQFPRRTFERRVRGIPVLPLDEHDLSLDPAHGGRRDGGRRRVTCQVQPGDRADPRRHLRVDGRVFHVERVEHAVLCVVGIEAEVDETGSEVALERELAKEPRASAGAVEVQVGREGLRLLVDDVERTVEVVDEESPASRLVAQEVDPGQLSSGVLPVKLAGDGQRREIGQIERQPRGRLRGKDLPGR
jgi:hypothetical protein